jgi:hypoxanthine phosphoribosyltransferase
MTTQEQLGQSIKSISKEIGFQQHAIFICVLNGAFMFFSDLIKNIDCVEAKIDFIRVKSYNGIRQGKLKLTKDIEIDIKDKVVYLIDDIYDSGKTLKYLIKHLSKHKPKKIVPVALFKRIGSDHPDLIYGIELAEGSFVYGYGLDDSKGFNRNLPFTLEE